MLRVSVLGRGSALVRRHASVAALQADGTPHPKTRTVPGASIERAEKRKPKKYREAARSRGRVKLLTLACEVGGRWSDQCLEFVRLLAKHKAKEAPPLMRRSAEYGWTARWWSLLSCAAQRSFASSITDVHASLIQPTVGSPPSLEDGVEAWRLEVGPQFSRLPLRG